jgi:hypothetical protein
MHPIFIELFDIIIRKINSDLIVNFTAVSLFILGFLSFAASWFVSSILLKNKWLKEII